MSLNYAQGTSVEAGKTLGQIQNLLARVGADRFGFFMETGSVQIVFSLREAMFRYSLPLPNPNDDKFCVYFQGSVKKYRTEGEASRRYSEEGNRRWRALFNLIKAELVAVEEGILTLEQALAPHLLTARGITVAEEVAGQIEAIGNGATMELSWSGGKK